MKTTVRGVILQINDQEKIYLDNLMDRFCAVVRWAYKRLFYPKDGKIYLDLAAEPAATGKVIRYSRITLPVYLAHKPSRKTGRINGRNYRQMVLNYLKTGQAYQMEIIRENGRYYIHVPGTIAMLRLILN